MIHADHVYSIICSIIANALTSLNRHDGKNKDFIGQYIVQILASNHEMISKFRSQIAGAYFRILSNDGNPLRANLRDMLTKQECETLDELYDVMSKLVYSPVNIETHRNS